ncbi:MAG: F0F1 ATP synthase subunit delta [Chloroflexota bacterium]|nr:F0F1 ATP synthase subunit delta [Chloroflexota bacterium]
MLELNVSTILLQMANFIVMVFILYRFLFKPLQNVLKERENGILRAMDEAQQARIEAEETRQIYEEKSNNIDVEIAARKNEARIVIERTRQQMLRDVQSQVEQIKAQTEESLTKLQKEAIHQHKETIGELASKFSKGILSDLMSNQLRKNFEQEFLDQISNLDLSAYIEGTRTEETNFIKVIMASKPAEAFEKKLTDILDKKISRKIKLSYEIDPSLVAGGILRFENKLIDGSLMGQIKLLKNKYQEAV